MILLNGPEIENFDYLKALEHWEGKKQEESILNFFCNTLFIIIK